MNEPVPYIVHESILARMERTIKRLWILCIIRQCDQYGDYQSAERMLLLPVRGIRGRLRRSYSDTHAFD